MWKEISYFIVFSFLILQTYAQQKSSKTDSLGPRQLDSVVIITKLREALQKPLPIVKGTYLFAAKKTESVTFDKLESGSMSNCS